MLIVLCRTELLGSMDYLTFIFLLYMKTCCSQSFFSALSLFLFRLFDFLCFSKSFHTSSCIEYFLLSRCYSFFKIALDHLQRTGHARRVLLFDFFFLVLTAFSFFSSKRQTDKKRKEK